MSEPSLGPKMPGWQMSEESLRALASEISAGRSLVPQSWHEDNRVAVLLSFDVDTQTWELMNGGRPSSSDLSQGEYGARVGLQRVVDRLTEYRVPASFFVPAVSAMLHPGMVETLCAAGGHEIGVHGWVHEHPSSLEPSEELDLMERSVELLTSQAGRRPVGYRAPAYDVHAHTFDILRNLDFLYDSSLMADDRPYEILKRSSPRGSSSFRSSGFETMPRSSTRAPITSRRRAGGFNRSLTSSSSPTKKERCSPSRCIRVRSDTARAFWSCAS